MTYGELQPAQAMRPFVLSYWHFRVLPGAGEVLHRVPLTGSAMLSVFERASSVTLVGPRRQPLQFSLQGGDEFFGVHVRPGSTEALFGVPGSSLRDVHVQAADVLGARWPAELLASLQNVRDLQHAAPILHRALRELQPRAACLDSAVMKAVEWILRSAGSARIEQIAAAVGLSARQLRRRFRSATGVSPKELALIRRVRAVIADAATEPSTDWCDLAIVRGYSDQSHLVREVRRTLGAAPDDYMHHARRIKYARVRR